MRDELGKERWCLCVKFKRMQHLIWYVEKRRHVHTRAGGRTDGQTDGRMDGRTEEWTDGRTGLSSLLAMYDVYT